MKHYLTILRPMNGIMSAFAVLIGAIVVGGSLGISVYLGMVSVFLICGAGMAINDYYDADIDKTNKPNRPIPSGKMSKNVALGYSIILFVIGLAISYYINIATFITAIAASTILIVYAAKMKKTILMGNVLVSAMVALTFIYGGLIFNNFYSTLSLALLSFLSNMAREIFKTIDDAIGDQKYNVNSVAIKLGVVHTRLLANIFTTSAVIFSFLPYFLGVLNETYLFFVVIADMAFIASVISPVKHGSKLIKIAMFISLIAFLAGSVKI
jgi:geranylgeranylglycerol-phosphate geranylgeranyltransferase